MTGGGGAFIFWLMGSGLVLSLLWIRREVINAPLGYEDERGFHLGQPNSDDAALSRVGAAGSFPKDTDPAAELSILSHDNPTSAEAQR